MDIANRLDRAMKAAGIGSQAGLARASGIPQPTINRILKNVGKRGPEAHTLAALARAVNVSFEWLHEGKGRMERTADGEQDVGAPVQHVAVSDDDAEFCSIRLADGFVHAGCGADDGDLEYEDHVTVAVSRAWIQQKGLNAKALRAVRVKGQSNYPKIQDGNIVIVNTEDRDIVVGEYYAVNHNLKAVVKRIERESGIWYLASDNPLPQYKRQAVEDSEAFIIGRVVKLEADFI